MTAAVVRILGVINESTAYYVAQELAKSPSQISLIVNSPGGLVDPAYQIHDALRASGAKIFSRAISKCCSAATIVLLAGDVREATADCKFVIHGIAAGPANRERWTAETHIKSAAQIRADNKKLANFYWSRTGFRPEKFLAQMEGDDEYLTAQRARDEFGLIHQIIAAPTPAPRPAPRQQPAAATLSIEAALENLPTEFNARWAELRRIRDQLGVGYIGTPLSRRQGECRR